MPELPDVEVLRRYAERHALHQTVEAVNIESKKMLDHISGKALEKTLSHHRFDETRRHGKYLFLKVDAKHWLYMHFVLA